MTVARCLPARCLLIAIAPLLLAACGSSAPSLSTGSLFGSKADAATPIAAPPPPPPATPEQRAAQVGATSARAVKCGYNFDPAKLKTSFLTAEAQSGTAVDQLGRVEKAYDSINVQVAAAIVGDGGFCTEAKTREIKGDLTRHLGGDYSPPQQQRTAQGGGFFGNVLDSSSSSNKPMTADDFWEKSGQQRKARP